MFRLLLSPKLTVTMQELETAWSYEDFIVAHQTLTALEEAEEKALERANKK